MLEDGGFGVIEAETATEALQVNETSAVSLITLDLNLGSDNGIDLARQIRRTSQVPIIMVTDKEDVIDRVVGLEVGADDHTIRARCLRGSEVFCSALRQHHRFCKKPQIPW